VRQQKQVHECPNCGSPLKRIIGAATRAKYWICTKGGDSCFKVKVGAS
jgi:ssDNA-binding Zn-finger/Zn-ribbon topoisomerase 1